VDDPKDPHLALYDFDLDQHVLMLYDVFDTTVEEQLKTLQQGGMGGGMGGGGMGGGGMGGGGMGGGQPSMRGGSQPSMGGARTTGAMGGEKVRGSWRELGLKSRGLDG